MDRFKLNKINLLQYIIWIRKNKRWVLLAQGSTASQSIPSILLYYDPISRFIFGVNGELKNNIYLLEDHRLLYVSGHNIVLYNTEDKS